MQVKIEEEATLVLLLDLYWYMFWQMRVRVGVQEDEGPVDQ